MSARPGYHPTTVTGDLPGPPAPALTSGRFPGQHRGDPASDPLESPDPAVCADAAASENLLRCWVRETAAPAPDGDTLHVELPLSATALTVPVLYWSECGQHRFGPPALQDAPAGTAPLDAVTLAALLAREGGPSAPGGIADLVARVADSVQRTARFVAYRRAHPGPPPGADPFLDAEQSLVLGHPLHPTPKSRDGLTEAEDHAWSPELHGSFPLHWLAVDRSVLAADSAWTEGGTRVPPGEIALRLAPRAVSAALPPGTVPLPVHPWQARTLTTRPESAALLAGGLLHDLGPHGEPWHPTSSVRTVHRPGAPAMLKLSLGLRITNSRRENLRKEALRGTEVHRLLVSGLGQEWQAAHPGFDIVRDPAWLGVDAPGSGPLPGLDVVVRHNPFGPHDDALCLASLTSPRPSPGEGSPGRTRSRLADVVERLAQRAGRPVGTVATEWFLRYLHAVVAPVLWLDAHAGVALEAHQQNTVVLLDADGWPRGGRYRDNQGYYFRASHRDALDARLPGAGQASDTFVADDVTDERFAYYLGVNNVLGLIGAFGAQGLAAEAVLLAALRRFLAAAARPAGGGPVSPLPALLLDRPTLRCKANLLTRLRGMDELVGPVDTQSVYVTVPNPVHR